MCEIKQIGTYYSSGFQPFEDDEYCPSQILKSQPPPPKKTQFLFKSNNQKFIKSLFYLDIVYEQISKSIINLRRHLLLFGQSYIWTDKLSHQSNGLLGIGNR